MKSNGGRGVDATLAAIATMAAAWPVSTLLGQPTWVGRTVLLMTVIVLSGIGARSLALRGWQVLTVQLVCVVLAASAIYGQGHLWHGLPTFETLELAGKLVREALDTAQRFAAPAPTTPGLMFVVGGALGLIALAVDYLAVTRRSPSLAGLPLLAAFLAAAANSGSSLPVPYFLTAAAMWLVLVARAGNSVLRRWGTTVTVARTPVRGTLDPEGVFRYSSVARAMGAAALVAAVAMPVVLPQLPPKFLLSGLGRNPLAQGNTSGGVGFSLSINLADDLTDLGTEPVLRYTTADSSPPPLLVSVGSAYRSAPGVWLPFGRPLPNLSRDHVIPEPPGLLPGVPRTAFTTTFAANLLEEPNLAVPFPLIAVDLQGIEWGADEQTQSVRVAARPSSYSASYWRLEPTPAMLQSTPSLSDIDRQLFERDLRLDGPSAAPVTALSERLTTGKNSDYDKAMAIQQYLRADGGFKYSLTLAPPVKNSSGNNAGLDPLTNFLTTKQGYCVQFATAMVMMSRAAGIPARMDIGFLPGTRTKGVWTVTASDAHAWPELYLDGIGWTRFEPTPTRAVPPGYATGQNSGATQAGGRPVDDTRAPAPRKTASRDLGDPATTDGINPAAGLSPASVFRSLTHGWGPVLLGVLLGLCGSLVVPTAARWRRRRDLMAARTSAQRVEVEWQHLTSSLSDLGIPPAPSRTPRQLRAYYDHEALLDGEASQALGRALQTLERSRYAGSATAPDGLAADARHVLRSAAATRRLTDRLRAALWPSRGLAQLRAARVSLVWSIRAPVRDAKAVVRQRFSRRR
jgi:transglutaminase-like putative cysteine protease